MAKNLENWQTISNFKNPKSLEGINHGKVHMVWGNLETLSRDENFKTQKGEKWEKNEDVLDEKRVEMKKPRKGLWIEYFQKILL